MTDLNGKTMVHTDPPQYAVLGLRYMLQRRVRDKEFAHLHQGTKTEDLRSPDFAMQTAQFPNDEKKARFCSTNLELSKVRIACTYTGAKAADPCVHDQNSPYTYIRSCTRIPNVVNPWEAKDSDFLNWYG